MKEIVSFERRDRRNVSFRVDSWTYKERLRRRREKDQRRRVQIKENAAKAEIARQEANLRKGFVEVGNGLY